MTNKPGRTSHRTNKLRDELILELTLSGDKGCSYMYHYQNCGTRHFYLKKYSSDRCPNPVYFNTPLLITYFSAIKTFICHREVEFVRFYFFRFCTKYVT